MPTRPTTASARSLVARAEQARRGGDLQAADRLLAQAASCAEDVPVPERIPALQLHAVVLMELGEHGRAEAVLRQALVLLRRDGEPVDDRRDRLTETLTALGTVLRLQGRHRWSDRVLHAAVTVSGDPTVSAEVRLAALTAWAMVRKDGGRLDEAELLYREVLDGYRALGRPAGEEVAATCHNLAVLARARGRCGQAEVWARRALAGRLCMHGPDDARVAAEHLLLAAALLGQGRPKEAEPIYRTALEVLERAYGPDHQEVAACHSGLAACRLADGDAHGGTQHLAEALRIKQALLGEESREVAVLRQDLAALSPPGTSPACWDRAGDT
jgi:tetratricopeptide (TPR) repeat protein